MNKKLRKKYSLDSNIKTLLFLFSGLLFLFGIIFCFTNIATSLIIPLFLTGMLFLAGGILWIMRKKIYFRNTPTLQQTVTVATKSFDYVDYEQVADSIVHNKRKYFYFVSFVLPDGSKKKFEIDIYQYQSISENGIGILTYKEKSEHLLFISFQHSN